MFLLRKWLIFLKGFVDFSFKFLIANPETYFYFNKNAENQIPQEYHHVDTESQKNSHHKFTPPLLSNCVKIIFKNLVISPFILSKGAGEPKPRINSEKKLCALCVSVPLWYIFLYLEIHPAPMHT